jgi:hypothetical protein
MIAENPQERVDALDDGTRRNEKQQCEKNAALAAT